MQGFSLESQRMGRIVIKGKVRWLGGRGENFRQGEQHEQTHGGRDI